MPVETINYWLLLPEVWVIAGLCLIVLEVAIGAAYFLLALGVASLTLSIVVYLEERDMVNLIDDWTDIAVWYAAFSLLAILILKLFVQSESKEDINNY